MKNNKNIENERKEEGEDTNIIELNLSFLTGLNGYLRMFAAAAESLQLCSTLCDSIDRSPPGCPVPGILQARTLEWVAISFSNA